MKYSISMCLHSQVSKPKFLTMDPNLAEPTTWICLKAEINKV